MHIRALAVGLGTIRTRGAPVGCAVRAGLAAVRRSGRAVILVTGRRLADLSAIEPSLEAYDVVVAEHGAVLLDPQSAEIALRGEPPPPRLVAALARRAIRARVGGATVSVDAADAAHLLAALQEQAVPWRVRVDRRSAVASAPHVDEGSGVLAALERLGISPHNLAGVGHEEADRDLLWRCELAAATADAAPALRRAADVVLPVPRDRGLVELLERYVLADAVPGAGAVTRHAVTLGLDPHGVAVRLPVHGARVLVVGEASRHWPRLAGVLVERLQDQGYQLCLVDPEGRHAATESFAIWDATDDDGAWMEPAVALAGNPSGVLLDLSALNARQTARLAPHLLAGLQAARARVGRPHWVIVDEAQQLFPADAPLADGPDVLALDGLCLVAPRVDVVARAALDQVTHLYAAGRDAAAQITAFADARGLVLPAEVATVQPGEDQAVAVHVVGDRLGPTRRFQVARRRADRGGSTRAPARLPRVAAALVGVGADPHG